MRSTIALAALAAALAACGGGGGSGEGAAAQSSAAAAGVYDWSAEATTAPGHWEHTSGRIYVHPDGSVAGAVTRAFQEVPTPRTGGSDDLQFSGTLAPGAIEFLYAGRRFTLGTDGITRWTDLPAQRGSASFDVAAAEGGARLAWRGVPFPMPAVTVQKQPYPVALQGMPWARVAGVYRYSYAVDWQSFTTEVAVDAATGAVSGAYGADCSVTGRMHAYDPASGMFRQELAFQGAGCPAQGTGGFVGRLESSPDGQRVVLLSGGIVAGQWVRLSLVHSQQLGAQPT